MKTIVVAALISLTALTASAKDSDIPAATKKGREFLTGLLDNELNLLPEYRGAKVYWLYHDNYLAAKVLNNSHPEFAQKIRSGIEREGVKKSGKIEILFGESEKPLPFRQYKLTEVRRAENKIIRTEVVTPDKLDGWAQYADLLLLACIAESNPTTARQHWDDALKMWDGKGFFDPAAKHGKRYATYKLGLALIAAQRFSPGAKPPDGLLEKLLSMQDESGGWITDYDFDGKKVGLANVETTCIAILGIEAAAKATPK